MSYKNLHEAIRDLEKTKQLIRIQEEIDPYLEMASLHGRIFQMGGPAIFYEKIKGSPFSAVSNLFGTMDRAKFLLRHGYKNVEQLIQLKADPSRLLKSPKSFLSSIPSLLNALPIPRLINPVLKYTCEISDLPQVQCWPLDGGPFITLPLVYTEEIKSNGESAGLFKSNLGMYRIQMQGNEYSKNKEIGLHYQIHRGIGVHHSKALQMNRELPVSIFIGGPPAHILSAIMPLPENIPEIVFGGILAGSNFRYMRRKGGAFISEEADFCITGKIINNKLSPEGPFGDHLGYYSLKHDFPVLKVDKVYHRKGAIWPFTVVGRPPQEDSILGKLIHELTAPLVPQSIFGLKAMHAVDASGVHPLLLAQGRESYTPYKNLKRPAELLTIANAILGFNQASLAKYLFIMDAQDDPSLDIHNVPSFFKHILERVDWRRDLHFQTCTTVDTLDYSGAKNQSINEGSKVVVAAAGNIRRHLSNEIPKELLKLFAKLPESYKNPKVVSPGILALSSKPFENYEKTRKEIAHLQGFFAENLGVHHFITSQKNESRGFFEKVGIHIEESNPENSLNQSFPLVVLVDDSNFVSQKFENWLWTCFTRSDPARDIYGLGEFYFDKHWGCEGPILIDARMKPHYAPVLESDPKIERRVDEMIRKLKL